MLITPKQSNLMLEARNIGFSANNTIDCDVVFDACRSLDECLPAGSDDAQQNYENLHYLNESLKHRGHESKRLREVIEEFTFTLSLFHHIQNKNGEAVALWNKRAEEGEVVRII